MLWAVFTLIAAAAQTARNATQRELTATLGTVGATHVRFLFGFPFALLFLAGVAAAVGEGLPSPPAAFWRWALTGALAQIAATATMLAVMRQRSFVISYAYVKTEPIPVALFGLIFLGDKIKPLAAAAILLATVGVIVISLKQGASEEGTARSTVIGLFSGALFALSAIGYRGAILTLHVRDFVMAATFTVTVGLVIQAAALTLYLWLRDRQCCTTSCAPGNRRCSPALWAPSRRNSGFWASPSPPPPMCVRWRWSRYCSRRPWRT